jgi:putative transposase
LAQGLSLAPVCQQLALSEPTRHRWRNQYGGLKADEAKRLKELEVENARLKKLVVELSLDKPMLQEVVQKN